MPLKCMEKCKKSVFREIGDLTKVPQYGASLTAVNVTIPSYSPQTYLFTYLLGSKLSLLTKGVPIPKKKYLFSIPFNGANPPDPDFERIHQISCTNFLVWWWKNRVSGKHHLEPQTTIYKWLFQLDDSQSLHRKWLFHQTSISKW